MAKHLSEQDKGKIIGYFESGFNYRNIAEKLMISIGTVSNIINRYKKNMPLTRKQGTGPKNKINKTGEEIIFKMINDEKNFNAVKAADTLKMKVEIECCPQTIRNFLQKNDFKAYSIVKKPFLSPKNILLRYDISKQRSYKPLSFWQSVIFSDESKFCLFNSINKNFIWRKTGTGLDISNVKTTKKFGGRSIMVWGCFSYHGFSELVLIDGILDKYQYVSIINKHLRSFVEKHGINDYVFQQDNDPKHTAGYTIDFFEKNSIDLLTWPPQSPDLNPIENVWGDIKRKLAGKEFRKKEELFEEIKTIWNNYDILFARKLINSMNKRILEVLRSKGGYSGY